MAQPRKLVRPRSSNKGFSQEGDENDNGIEQLNSRISSMDDVDDKKSKKPELFFFSKHEDKLDRWLEILFRAVRNRQIQRRVVLLSLGIFVFLQIRITIIRYRRAHPIRVVLYADPDLPPEQVEAEAAAAASTLNWLRGTKNEAEERLKQKRQNTKPDVCFVTSSYAKDTSNMDNLVRVINGSPYLRFYIFTNLNDNEWTTPGWEKIITNYTYRRRITHSRYGKFLGWKYPQLQECRAVVYMDSCIRPTQRQEVWRKIAKQIESSEVGFMQDLNPKNRSGIFGEFLAIQKSQKDMTSNIVNSLRWMVQQPDFDENIPIYWNEQFGYNPKSKVYQQLSQAFWDRYAQEEDSWRDQPLWAFMIHRYNVTPMSWPEDEVLWGRSRIDYGHNAHEYYSENDVLADWIYSPETEPPVASVLGLEKDASAEDFF